EALSPEEQIEIDRLGKSWKEFVDEYDSFPRTQEQQEGGKPKTVMFPEKLQDSLRQLQINAESVYQASKATAAKEIRESRVTSRTVSVFSWCAAAIALVASALVSFLIYRSISIPLSHLTEGTRAIAEGKFYYRLDTSRNDEFSQLAKDFNTMTLQLNELDELKRAFISHVSHELKAPLASMRETIQLMLEEIPGPLTDKQKRLLELNLQSGARLTSMIANLLDLSRIEAGVIEYELKPLDLAPLVRNAIALLEGRVHEKNLTVEQQLPDQPLAAECDGDRIIQVLVNLIGNAVKFSPTGSSIKVRVQPTDVLPSRIPQNRRHAVKGEMNGNEYALVSVSDSGPGIPDAEKERVFERFHQVKQARKGTGRGVGLGLTICRTIIEAHGGAIWVEDNPPQGSTFRVLLLRAGEKGKSVVKRASTPI
ncbi:MAG TPA: HAMP domain-containing sensor histidine kinase, partial [Acidobacteriota bacterium]|nr:HAMP domain-containing sensor histidine kinase [Acidobacteriota bacterium]